MSAYSDAVLADNPVGYWKLDELSGTSANDEVGSNDGTYTNVTLGVDGALADGTKAGSWPGIQAELVEVAHHASLAGLTGDLTLEAWLYLTDAGTHRSIMAKANGAQPAPFDCYLANGNRPRLLRGNGLGANDFADCDNTIGLNAWHHLVITMTGTTVTFYIDGVQSGTTETLSTTIADGGTAFRIGRRNDDGIAWVGRIDEVAIYDTVLSAARVAVHYDVAFTNEPEPAPPPPPETQSKLAVGDIGPPGGLTVRLKTDLADVHVTKDIRSLRFSNGVPGGFKTLELTLDRPLALSPQEIRLYGDCYVYSGRSGAIVWQGRLEDPGRGSTNDGQIWTVRAVGHFAHASDITRPLVYVNRSLEPFYVAAATEKKFLMSRQDESDTNGALRLFGARNTVLAANDIAAWRCDIFREAGMKLARIRMSAIGGAGFGDDNRIQIVTFVGGTGDEAKDAAWSDTEQSLTALVVTDFDNEDDAFQVRYKRVDTGATIGSDAFWHLFYTVIARSLLVDASGTEITTGYTLNTVKTHEIVKDLIGRLCTDWDGANAVIDETSTYTIEQLSYLDGTTAAQVAEDLALFESKYWLAVWEEKTVAGKAVPYWAQWPTSVRYEATTRDGFDSPGSSLELFDAVTVRWRDEQGRIRRTRRTQTVAVLTDAGLAREAFIDIGDELASLANAQRVGDQFLLDHAAPPNAGTLTIRRPIVDRVVGGRVQPWEIRAGNLIRVRDVLPSADALNVSDRDAVTVFRVVEVDYESSTNTATLQLDSQARTLSKLVNRRSQIRRR